MAEAPPASRRPWIHALVVGHGLAALAVFGGTPEVALVLLAVAVAGVAGLLLLVIHVWPDRDADPVTASATRRVERRRLFALTVFGVSIIGGASAMAAVKDTVLDARARTRMAACEPLIAAAEAHRRTHGSYPGLEVVRELVPERTRYYVQARGDAFGVIVDDGRTWLGWDWWTYSSQTGAWRYVVD